MRIFLTLICFSITLFCFAQEKQNGRVKIPFDLGIEKGKMRHGQRQGVWRRYDADGRLTYQMTYKNGIKDGAEISYNYKDSINSSGYYKNGNKDGGFISMANGRTVSFYNYVIDTLHGNCFQNSPSKSFAGLYDHGKKTGTWVVDSVDYRKKRIKDSTSYVKGLKEGSSFIFTNSILVSKSEWVAGKRNGAHSEYDETTGKLIVSGSYLNNNRHGGWNTYENSQLRKVEDFENGIHSGNTIQYGKDTTVILGVEKYNIEGSKKYAEEFDESGHLVQLWYYGPKEDIDSTLMYYPNGRIKNAHYTAYENNEGFTQFFLYMSYYPNGKLETRGFEYKQSRNGNWLSYDSTGALLANIQYEDNMPFGWFQTYYPNGKVKVKAYCYEAITDTILVYSKTGARVAQSDPAYSKTIQEVQLAYPSILFRDPNKFPVDHKKKGKVALGDIVSEGVWSDEPPQFPGGNDSLSNFISRHVSYPEPERRLSLEGTVVIKFLVEKDGALSDIQVERAVKDAPGFTKETLGMMRAMPKWKPAKTKGKIVRVYHQVPIHFSLKQ